MITEEEARKKWCPFARLSTGANRSLHNMHKLADGTRCVASECMAWRRGSGEFERLDANGNPDPDCTGPSPWTYPDKKSVEGFCGLAGKP